MILMQSVGGLYMQYLEPSRFNYSLLCTKDQKCFQALRPGYFTKKNVTREAALTRVIKRDKILAKNLESTAAALLLYAKVIRSAI